MADNNWWVKVPVAGVLLDPAMALLPLDDLGRWLRLKALAAATGTDGTIEFPPAADALLHALRVTDVCAVTSVLTRLPFVTVSDTPNRYGGITVTIKNPYKDRYDRTAKARMRRYRNKMQQRESKRERKKNPLLNPPPNARGDPAERAPTPTEDPDHFFSSNFSNNGPRAPMPPTPANVQSVLDRLTAKYGEPPAREADRAD